VTIAPTSVAGSRGSPTVSCGERLGEGADDLVVPVLGHDEPAGVGAALAVVPGDARHQGLDDAVEVGVVEHEGR
jgi:hypothetical protein